MTVRMMLIGSVVLGLAACATPATVYGPAENSNAIGYREQALEADRYRISFRANPDLDAAGVEDLAMRRAAEVTLRDGGDWFRVVTRDTERYGGRESGGTSVGVGGSTGSFGSSVGVGVGFDLSPDSRRYETIMEILVGTGPKPDEARVYDARSVLTRTSGQTLTSGE